jgi:hypothetical protein
MRVQDIPLNNSAPDAPDPPKGQFLTEPRQGDPYLVQEEDYDYEAVEKHPPLLWTSLRPGDVVYIRGLGVQDGAGTVESRTSDGLIIWIRGDLNERRLFHFRECQSVRIIR